MGIYIPGIELPKDREICLRIDEKGEVYVYGSYPTELYKAVPVPPHGRLIAADALTDCLATLLQFPSNLVNGQWIVNTLREQPTIIPAEEGE